MVTAAGDVVIVRVFRLRGRKFTTWEHRRCQRCAGPSATYLAMRFYPGENGEPRKVYCCGDCLTDLEREAYERADWVRVEATSPALA